LKTSELKASESYGVKWNVVGGTINKRLVNDGGNMGVFVSREFEWRLDVAMNTNVLPAENNES